MTELTVTEGHVQYSHHSEEGIWQTYFKKFHNPHAFQEGTVIIVVPGGPCFGHDYLLDLQRLAQRVGVLSVVFYDWLGCGKSTHLPEKDGDESFWTLDLLVRELANLIENLDDIAPEARGRFDILGHSLGAQIGAMLAAQRPRGLRKLVLSNGTTNWVTFNASNLKILDRYPSWVKQSIIETEELALGRRDTCNVPPERYQAALHEYRREYCFRRPDANIKLFLDSMRNTEEAIGAFTAFAGGRVEMIWAGSLIREDCTSMLAQIHCPTLVIQGEWDKVTEECSRPFVTEIPNVALVVLANTSHFPQFEEPEKWMEAIYGFLCSQ